MRTEVELARVRGEAQLKELEGDQREWNRGSQESLELDLRMKDEQI